MVPRANASSARRRVGVGLVACAALLAADAQAVIRAAPVVSVTLGSRSLIAHPSKVPVGRVVFHVSNRAANARRLTVGRVRTALIAPGQSVTLRVDFRTRAPYTLIETGRKSTSRITGLVRAFEPCASPSSTTIGVRVDHGRTGITLSRPTIPCGTVTFVVTNIGTAVDSLQFFADYPQKGGTTPDLQPGQSARVTIQFPEKGIAHYQSGIYIPGEDEFGGSDADGGSARIV